MYTKVLCQKYFIQLAFRDLFLHITFTGAVEAKRVRRILENVLRKRFSDLSKATKKCISEIAADMYSKNLISETVKDSPNYNDVIHEFVADMSFKNNVLALEDHCRLFLDCLINGGGPAKQAAYCLAKDWEQDVLREANISLCLYKEDIPKNISKEIIPLSSEDQVARDLQNLQRKFVPLLTNIRNYFGELVKSGKFEVVNIARWAAEYTDETGLTQVTTIDELFDKIHGRYHFLHCELIEELVEQFPPDIKLQTEVEEYIKKLELFEKSAQLKDIKTAIETALESKRNGSDQGTCEVVIKLTGKWRQKTKESLERLIKFLFAEKRKFLSHIHIETGSITIRYLAPSSQAQSLIVMVEAKVKVMLRYRYLGIFQMSINNYSIIMEEEDINFTFEQSLLGIIKNIGSDSVSEEIALLLIELGIDVNYQNEEGQTALMLASDCGHIAVVTLLLMKNADPNIQQKNGQHVGFTALAYSVISQNNPLHVTKTLLQFGAETNILIEGMSILDRAEAEGRVDTCKVLMQYNALSASMIVELKTAFHKLRQFYANLNTIVLTAIEELVTERKQSLVQIKHHLQSYIEEETVCDTADDLFDLLQPHYSCFNVNILKDITTKFFRDELKNEVEAYVAKLKAFESTTQLWKVKLAMEHTHFSLQPNNNTTARVIIKFNNQWKYKTLADVRKFESYSFSTLQCFLNHTQIQQEQSTIACVYLVPRLKYTNIVACAGQEQHFMSQVGVRELLIDDQQILIEEKINDFTFESALLKGVEANNDNIISFLLDINVKLAFETDVEDTSITEAAKENNKQLVDLLINQGCNIDSKNELGYTALMNASFEGHYQVVELLLAKEANINIQNDNGVTALMLASHCGHNQVVELLLTKEPDIDIQSYDRWTALILASSKGHHQIVELLLAKNPNINIQSNDGSSALILASRNGHHQVVKLLLTKEPDINIQSKDGWTAVMLASGNGYYQVIELLLTKNPNLNLQDNDGWTALMSASQKGYHQVVELLLTRELDVNIQRSNGMNALMYASGTGHHRVVQLLLNKKDPEINIQNKDGSTALMLASRYGHHQVVKHILTKEPDLNLQDRNSITALMLASGYGHHQVVKLLLTKEPDLNLQDKNGVTALMYASENGHYQIVGLLLTKEQDINIKSNNGWTASMLAGHHGHHQVIELLLTKDPDMNIKNKDGWTTLMLASGNGHYQVVRLLLTKELDLNIQDNDGYTALMLACFSENDQVVKLLLTKEPDVNIQDNNGVTALIFASSHGNRQIVELLLTKRPDLNIQNKDGWSALSAASRFGHDQIVELLLTKEPDVNIRDNIEWTALMYASRYGHHRIVELLLMKKPDIDIKNADGITACMLACGNGHQQVIELLLAKEPNINIQDNDGLTALMFACHYGYYKIIEVLLAMGTDIDIQDKNGVTALILASRLGHHKIVQLLLSKGPDVNIQNKDGISALSNIVLFTSYFLRYIQADDDIIQCADLNQSESHKSLELLLDAHVNLVAFYSNHNEPIHAVIIGAVSNNVDAINIIMKKCDVQAEVILDAFVIACHVGHSSVITFLASKLPNLSPDQEELIVACAGGDLGIVVSKVFESDLSPDTPLVGGLTPLMIAATCGHYEVVDSLIQVGAEINNTTDGGYTALSILESNMYEHGDVVCLLLENGAVRKSEEPPSQPKKVDSSYDHAKVHLDTEKPQREERNLRQQETMLLQSKAKVIESILKMASSFKEMAKLQSQSFHKANYTEGFHSTGTFQRPHLQQFSSQIMVA